MVRVKICGVNSEAAFDAAAQAGADWIGFVFFDRSPRGVRAAEAAALSARLAGGPLRVGLFVDPEDDAIARVLDAVQLDALQLYTPAARVDEIAERFGVAVWRSVGVSAPADLPADAGRASRLVIEAKPPAGADRPGGNAVAVDWAMLSGHAPRTDWMLAGGLTAANVGQAIAHSGAAAVDVSSGVESAPGVKEPALIRAFVVAARQGRQAETLMLAGLQSAGKQGLLF